MQIIYGNNFFNSIVQSFQEESTHDSGVVDLWEDKGILFVYLSAFHDDFDDLMPFLIKIIILLLQGKRNSKLKRLILFC